MIPVAVQSSQSGVRVHETHATLDANNGSRRHNGVVVPVAFAQNTRDEVREMPVIGALAAQPGMKQTSYVRTAMQVRRLTPRECERLQGFPDDYTLIPWRGKPAADGPRYKALGNSMAVPVMRWIGERIAQVEALS
jgi:DNA (cytosine-5)-methyltransferase 1